MNSYYDKNNIVQASNTTPVAHNTLDKETSGLEKSPHNCLYKDCCSPTGVMSTYSRANKQHISPNTLIVLENGTSGKIDDTIIADLSHSSGLSSPDKIDRNNNFHTQVIPDTQVSSFSSTICELTQAQSNDMVINDLNDEIRSLKEISAENNVSLTGFINERLKAMNEIRKVDFIIFYF